MGLLDSQVKKIIAGALKGKLLKGTLRREPTISLNASGDQVSGAAVLYRVEGFVDEYSAFYRKTAGIPDTDLKIVLIAGLMTTSPLKGDLVMFPAGEWAGQWFKLRTDSSDPAGAHFECPGYAVAAPIL